MSLDRIAQRMIAKAKGTGWAQQTLDGGLTITYQIDGDNRCLSLTRLFKQASATERDVCRQAFGVPAWVTYRDHIHFDYVNGYGVTRIAWGLNQGQLVRKIAQGHLEIGLYRWQQVIGETDYTQASSDILARLLDDIASAKVARLQQERLG